MVFSLNFLEHYIEASDYVPALGPTRNGALLLVNDNVQPEAGVIFCSGSHWPLVVHEEGSSWRSLGLAGVHGISIIRAAEACSFPAPQVEDVRECVCLCKQEHSSSVDGWVADPVQKSQWAASCPVPVSGVRTEIGKRCLPG